MTRPGHNLVLEDASSLSVSGPVLDQVLGQTCSFPPIFIYVFRAYVALTCLVKIYMYFNVSDWQQSEYLSLNYFSVVFYHVQRCSWLEKTSDNVSARVWVCMCESDKV